MAAQRRATSVNLLRAEEVAFSLFSLGFLSCVTARDDPWAGILLFPGEIKPIECVGWKRPFNHPFPQNPDHYCSFWGSNQGGFFLQPVVFSPLWGPRLLLAQRVQRGRAGAVAVGSSVCLREVRPGLAQQEHRRTPCPQRRLEVQLNQGWTGRGDTGGWSRRAGPPAWHEETRPQGCRAAWGGSCFLNENPPQIFSFPVGGMLGVVME